MSNITKSYCATRHPERSEGSTGRISRSFASLRMTICCLFSMPAMALSQARADWPEFRGPTCDGHAPAGLPLTLSESQNVKWKTAIPHRGWSTPVVLDKQIWLTTATIDGHDFYAVCVNLDDGKIRFTKHLFHSANPEPLGNPLNCYASPSPVIEPGRVFVHFGS